MSCRKCGREDGHWLGCVAVAPSSDRHGTRESECIKDGCTNPRAASKGPRPTKYCDEHKTGSKK